MNVFQGTVFVRKYSGMKCLNCSAVSFICFGILGLIGIIAVGVSFPNTFNRGSRRSDSSYSSYLEPVGPKIVDPRDIIWNAVFNEWVLIPAGVNDALLIITGIFGIVLSKLCLRRQQVNALFFLILVLLSLAIFICSLVELGQCIHFFMWADNEGLYALGDIEPRAYATKAVAGVLAFAGFLLTIMSGWLIYIGTKNLMNHA